MLLFIEKTIDRVLDLVLRLAPGSRFNPDSIESRIRRNWGTYNRARDRATQLLTDAAEHQQTVEAEAKSRAQVGIKAAEVAIRALEARADRLHNITQRR